MSEPTDEELIESFRKGRQDAFRALFDRHKARVYNTALCIVRDREDALDVLQEVFLTVFRKATGFRHESRFRTWLTRIAMNCSINRAKRRKTHSSVPIEDRPADTVADPLRSDALERAFGRLDPELRAVLTLRYFEGMEYPEIAMILDCPAGTVKSRLHRAHLKLKELLDHEL